MKNKCVFALLVILALMTGCDNPTGSSDDDVADPLVGTWRNAAETNFLMLNEDGTTETPDLRGTWTVYEERLVIDIDYSKIDGVFQEDSGTLEFNYLLADGKLYRDTDIYIYARTSADTGITGTFERIKQADDDSWVKEVFNLDDTPEYTVYANTPADYNPVSGTGTWTVSVALTGTISTLPLDDPVGGKVLEIDITGVSPVMEAFPAKVYSLIFYTNDRLSIDCEGYVKSAL